jgi:hypothetical protein
MNKNQFFYTRKETIKMPTGELSLSSTPPYAEKIVEFKDSFNYNKVIRTRELEDHTILVVLDDFHEEMREVPGFHPKTRKPTGVYVKERNTYQSEIVLSKEDGDRLSKIISID